MTIRQTSILLILFFIGSLQLCSGISLSKGVENAPRGEVPGLALALISAAAILVLAYVVIGCVCCPNRSIKALTYQNGFPVSRLNENLQLETGSEFAIFPPHSAVIDLQPVSLACPPFEDKVTFEPLPDILPRRLSGQSAACSSRPAHFRALLKNKVSLHDWFDDPNSNFPRDQLQYLKELGCGWFGRVVEGEATGIVNAEEKTPVVVKILREEASPSEHLHFLHEVRPYRDLSHPNVVRLLGRCLESDPFLLIMEHSTSDLKTYLLQQDNKETLVKNGILLQMACNVAAGLKHLHDNGFTHLDLAAHNCFVCRDSTVKIGDYGISFDRCRGDYYWLGDIALPIRWCSPETLLCTETTIETKEISREANIWAFGVVLWEMFEFGKLPYEELTNEEVLQKVLIERSVQLPPPTREFPVKQEMSMIMKECWKAAPQRPSMEKLENFLTRLYNDRHNLKTLESSFEERWNALQPRENHPTKFDVDFSEKSVESRNSDGFSSFEMSFDLLTRSGGSQLSPSLRVLNGSIDELTENDACTLSLGCTANDAASVASDRDLPMLEDDPQQQLHLLDLVPPPNQRPRPLSEEDDANNGNPPHQRVDPPQNYCAADRPKAVDDNFNPLEVSSPESCVFLEIEQQSSLASQAVPDIVIHESPIPAESSSHDENENVVPEETTCGVAETHKPFRFVFREESGDTKATSGGSSSSGSNARGRAQPLTSTPLKSDLKCSDGFFQVFTDNDDSGNVFYSDSSAQVKAGVDETSRRGVPDSVASVYYDAPSQSSEAPFASANVMLSSKAGSSDQSDFASARSKFDSCNISTGSSFPSRTTEDSFGLASSGAENSGTLLADEPRAFLPEAESSSVEELKCPSPAEPKGIALAEPEDSLSIEYGEPATPEVSINVSSCSFGNDCRSISMDSSVAPPQGVSSEGLKTTSSSNDPSPRQPHLDYSSSDLPDSPDAASDSSPRERMEAVGNFRLQKPHPKADLYYNEDESESDAAYRSDKAEQILRRYDEDDLEEDSESDVAYGGGKAELRLRPYDEVIVEDLETGEQTVITESYSACDDYENSADSDEILKINIETDEAIIVDSSEALVGFVPSRSIELLQECEILPTLNPVFDDEKESSDSNNFDASNSASSSPAGHPSACSPCESPESTYPLHHPYRNFSLQNEVIEEEITDEIASPSSLHSTASTFSSNDIFTEEKMSEGSESVMPTLEHFFSQGEEGDHTDPELSPLNANLRNNHHHLMHHLNNNNEEEEEEGDDEEGHPDDVMYSWQPTQSVRWHSDETLDVGEDIPVILEGKEILAGGVLETHGMSVKDFTTALQQLDVEDQLNRLGVSPSSPFSSAESSPCRDAYTPDFESDSDGTSCSSTSGSFECINNKFKNSADISRLPDSSDRSNSDCSREQSPLKVFSKTWDCHATPTRGVLVTPEKKFSSMRKSVSFHEEDPQVVFEYPPASDSSEDNEPSLWNIDYQNYADWELQAGENEEIEEVLEIEELDCEPYVRRPTYGGARGGPMSRPMLYSLTSGFSDDDMDFPDAAGGAPPQSMAPSNSPEEGKQGPLTEDQISELIRSQLNNLALEENRLKWMQDVLESQASEFACEEEEHPKKTTLSEDDIVIEELSPGDCVEGEQEEVDLLTPCVQEEEGSKPDSPEKSPSHEFPSPSLSSNAESKESSDSEGEDSPVSEIDDNSSGDESLGFEPEDGDLPGESLIELEENLEPGSKNTSFLVKPELEWKLQEPTVAGGNSYSTSLLDMFGGKPDWHDADFPTLEPKSFPDHSPPVGEGPSYEISSLALDEGNKRPNSVKHKAPSDCDTDRHESPPNTNRTLDSIEASSAVLNDSCVQTDPNKTTLDDRNDVGQSSLKSESTTLENAVPLDPAETFQSSIPSLVEKTDNIQTPDDLLSNGDSGFVLPESEDDSEPSDSPSKHLVEATTPSHPETPEDHSESSDSPLKHLVETTTASHPGDPFVDSGVNTILNGGFENHLLREEVLSGENDRPSVSRTTGVVDSNRYVSVEAGITRAPSEMNSESALTGESAPPPLDSKEHLPRIVITPASESEFEDELEEYLRNRLELYHRPDEEEVDDFSVTSQYTVQPFEDVFGSSYGGGVHPGTSSSDYTEAFNFEFEGGVFFDDLIDDYPREVAPAQWTDVPAMVEKARSDSTDDPRAKSSPLYYAASDATHL